MIVYLLKWQEKSRQNFDQSISSTNGGILVLSITHSNRNSEHGKEDRKEDRGSGTSSIAKLRILCLVRRAAGERKVDKIWGCDEGFLSFGMLDLSNASQIGHCARIAKSWRRSKPSVVFLGNQGHSQKIGGLCHFLSTKSEKDHTLS